MEPLTSVLGIIALVSLAAVLFYAENRRPRKTVCLPDYDRINAIERELGWPLTERPKHAPRVTPGVTAGTSAALVPGTPRFAWRRVVNVPGYGTVVIRVPESRQPCCGALRASLDGLDDSKVLGHSHDEQDALTAFSATHSGHGDIPPASRAPWRKSWGGYQPTGPRLDPTKIFAPGQRASAAQPPTAWKYQPGCPCSRCHDPFTLDPALLDEEIK